ncbi:hypothetical protein ACFPRL_25350 [Pseudoclavibacter helvolus]
MSSRSSTEPAATGGRPTAWPRSTLNPRGSSRIGALSESAGCNTTGHSVPAENGESP